MVFLNEGNMRKQFFRVKQLADQTFARAERTEVLNDDLANKEKRVDSLKQVCVNTSRKLQACLQGMGTDGPVVDKRLRKLSHFQLGSSMEESATLLGQKSMLGEILHLCAQANECSAQHLLACEVEVEKLVLRKFLDIVEIDIPNINKSRKHLNKLTLDYDAANSRYKAADKQAPGNAKIDILRDESEDAYMKMEQYRDTLALEFAALLEKETELSQSLHDLLKSQAEYHRKSLRDIERIIPNLEKAIDNPSCKPTYGQPLDEHLLCRDRRVAIPIEACVCYLLKYGMEEEGLLRIAGSSSKVKKLKSYFNEGFIELKEYDPHTVAGTLKLYLRELPEPLMTFLLYKDWMETARHTDKETRLQAMFKVLHDLPNSNYNNLRYLIKFLSKLSASQDVNKMSSINIAIVIAPNLMWSPEKDQNGNMGLANLHSSIVDCLISNADYFFPGEEDFYQGLLPSAFFEEDAMACSPSEFVNGDEDRSGGDQPQSLNLESEAQASGSSKSPSSNGSPKSAGSPKVNRRPKKPAPPVPLQSRERISFDGYEDQAKPSAHMWPKPSLLAKPRHERKSSAGVSAVELGRPCSAPAPSDIVGGSVPSPKDQSVPPTGSSSANCPKKDSSAFDEWPAVTPRAIQAQAEEARRAAAVAPAPQAIEKTHVQILSIEKSKPTYMQVPSPTEDTPGLAAEDASPVDKSPGVPPSPVPRTQVPSNGSGSPVAPRRPPRPQPRPLAAPVAKPRASIQPEETRL